MDKTVQQMFSNFQDNKGNNVVQSQPCNWIEEIIFYVINIFINDYKYNTTVDFSKFLRQ